MFSSVLIFSQAEACSLSSVPDHCLFPPSPSFLGPNLVTAHGDDWRRQQVISKGVFNTDGWHFLWGETVRIFDGMMKAEGYNDLKSGDEVKIKHSVSMTLRVSTVYDLCTALRWLDIMNLIISFPQGCATCHRQRRIWNGHELERRPEHAYPRRSRDDFPNCLTLRRPVIHPPPGHSKGVSRLCPGP